MPTPGAPQSIEKYKKFAIPERLFSVSTFSEKSLPAGAKLMAIVDEKCVMKRGPQERLLSVRHLQDRVKQQASLLRERAYPIELRESFTLSSLKAQVLEDPCLISLDEETFVKRSATTVNDPSFSAQAHLTAINAPTAWDTFYSGLTSTVVIAIIDDGIELTHSDLSGVLWTNSAETASNATDDDGNGYADDVNGYNFTSSHGSPAHENGASHGTHVAGLSAAQDNNSIGVTGVMGRNLQIMGLNVFGPNASAGSSDIVNAINYARTMGANVINMSLGGLGSSASINTAMINAVAAGVFIAVAAGNSSEEITASNFYMPAGYCKDINGAMAVGSIDALTQNVSSFSNFSTTYVEIAAPGSDSTTGGVYSTYTSNSYSYLQGTSMASPVLAGAAALVVGWAKSRGKTVTPAQIETIIKASATSKSSLTPYFYGGGALNLVDLAATMECDL